MYYNYINNKRKARTGRGEKVKKKRVLKSEVIDIIYSLLIFNNIIFYDLTINGYNYYIVSIINTTLIIILLIDLKKRYI